ncbi:T-complex protein 11-like protein 2 isoform X8 [Ammospiza caudacuta]|uniref:T-complex protein 11-like protein 2 isoform X8 n=1 Tax=Ammospiza caudacuta TaxID=2857398 RepID=UPI002739F481|nr:T-complex protein 11-like protein 2 isoform X8 [Ammospiza caudacuta]
MDVPEEDTNSPGWVFKSEGGSCVRPSRALCGTARGSGLVYCVNKVKGFRMPLNDDQSSDSDSSRLSESTVSSSDTEYSRQSFNSDSSSKPSSPASVHLLCVEHQQQLYPWGSPCALLPFRKSSPPKVITFDELMAATRNLSNWTLAHEIAVNANFCIKQEDYPQNSFAGTVKQIVHKAFWDHLESELNEDPPEYKHAIKLFEEIKEILLSFLTPGANRIHNQICEVLDTDLIRQQAEHNAVDIPGLANYVINTMGKLCAPIRDNDIKQLKATDNIVELLRQIFHVLDLMKVDMANYTIKSLRPYLWHNLVDYERTKFQEILEETPSALNLTTEWIKESIEDELSSISDESSSCPGADSSSKPIISPTLVLNNGYLKLLQWDYCKTIPETLITDEVRLQELREKLNQLKVIACVSLITNNMVGAAVVDVPDFTDHLKRISLPLLEGMNKKQTNPALHEKLACPSEFSEVYAYYARRPFCDSERDRVSGISVCKHCKLQ